jgi:hypothetical protein
MPSQALEPGDRLGSGVAVRTEVLRLQMALHDQETARPNEIRPRVRLGRSLALPEISKGYLVAEIP